MIRALNGTHETVEYQQSFGVRVFINDANESYPRHWHTDTEIIMPLENGYTVVVDNQSYKLQEEEIIILPSGELHELHSPKSGKRIILQFDGNLLYNLNGFNSAFHIFRPCTEVTASTMPKIHRELVGLLHKMVEEYFSAMPFREASIYAMLLQFFITLGRNSMNQEESLPTNKRKKQLEYIDRFLNVCDYINEHCTENIPVETLADLAGFSRFHFTRLFKQFINMSYYDYLNSRRILYAEKLLIDPTLTIMQVAMKSGFNSLATFNRVFKANKKCTPSEYKSLYGASYTPSNNQAAAYRA